MDPLIAQGKGTFDPFDLIFETVSHLTVCAVSCKDIADDIQKIRSLISSYEHVANSCTPSLVVDPW